MYQKATNNLSIYYKYTLFNIYLCSPLNVYYVQFNINKYSLTTALL